MIIPKKVVKNKQRNEVLALEKIERNNKIKSTVCKKKAKNRRI